MECGRRLGLNVSSMVSKGAWGTLVIRSTACNLSSEKPVLLAAFVSASKCCGIVVEVVEMLWCCC